MARPSDAPTFTTAIPIFRTKFSYVLFLSKYLLQTPSQIIVTLRLTTACTPCYIWGYKLLGINVVFFFCAGGNRVNKRYWYQFPYLRVAYRCTRR